MASLLCTVQPTSEPVTISDLREHSRITIHDEDQYAVKLIASARQWCENYTRRQFVSATYRLKLDGFYGEECCCQYTEPGDGGMEIVLPYPPVQSVSSITYLDTSNATQTLASSVYELDSDSTPARIRLKYGQVWPTTLYHASAVSVTFVAGYGGASATDAQSIAAVPYNIKQAICMYAALLFENREGSNDEMRAIRALLDMSCWGCYV